MYWLLFLFGFTSDGFTWSHNRISTPDTRPLPDRVSLCPHRLPLTHTQKRAILRLVFGKSSLTKE